MAAEGAAPPPTRPLRAEGGWSACHGLPSMHTIMVAQQLVTIGVVTILALALIIVCSLTH
jgi:hypothetical protein